MGESFVSTERIQAADLLTNQPAPNPMLLPAVSFAVGIGFGQLYPLNLIAWSWLSWLAWTGVLLILIQIAARGNVYARRLAVTLGMAFCGLLRLNLAEQLPADHIAHHLSAEPVITRLSGTVASTPRTTSGTLRNPFYPIRPESRVRFLLQVEEADRGDEQVPLSGVIQVTVVPAETIHADLGDKVRLSGWLSSIPPPANPGGFDYRAWQKRRGVHAQLRVKAVDHVELQSDSHAYVNAWQRHLRAWAGQLLYGDSPAEDTAQLLDVLVLGQRSAASRELNDRFIRLGAAAFLAVSGFHIGILALTVATLSRLLLSRERTAWLVMGVLLGYVIIVEPNPPVLRATLMGVLASFAVILGRPPATLNWWATAGITLLIINPLALVDIGFQFTLSLVLMLLTLWPTLTGFLNEFSDHHRQLVEIDDRERHTLASLIWHKSMLFLGGLCGVSIVTWLAALPIVALHFGRFAPVGFFSNILMAPVVVITIWASLLNGLINLLLQPAGISVNWAGSASAVLLDWSEFLDHRIGMTWQTARVPWLVVTLSYVPLLTWSALKKPRYVRRHGKLQLEYRTRGLILATLLLPSVVLWVAWMTLPLREPPVSIDLLSLSRGSGTLINTGGEHLLIDGGTVGNWDAASSIRESLRELNIPELDGAILTGHTAGYYSAWPELAGANLIRWMDKQPAVKSDTAAVRRLMKATAGVPTISIPEHYILGRCALRVFTFKGGRRALLIEFGSSRVLYALSLEIEEFKALLPELNSKRIGVVIAPTRVSRALKQVLQSIQDLGAGLVIVALDPDLPALKKGDDFMQISARIHNTWSEGAIRLIPDSDTPIGWRIQSLSERSRE